MPNKTILDYLKQNDISDTTKFSLQDDGEGVYIKDWGYLLQKPTLPSPEATELRALKSKKIAQIKGTASSLILATYPIHKQLNTLMSEEAQAIETMNLFILPIRTQSNVLEAQVSSCTTSEELENININFE